MNTPKEAVRYVVQAAQALLTKDEDEYWYSYLTGG
jgi:hypothetical protein